MYKHFTVRAPTSKIKVEISALESVQGAQWDHKDHFVTIT